MLSSATCTLDKARTKFPVPRCRWTVGGRRGRRPPDGRRAAAARTTVLGRPGRTPVRQATPGRVEHRGRARGSRRSWRTPSRGSLRVRRRLRWSRPRWSAARSTSRYSNDQTGSVVCGPPWEIHPAPARPSSPSEPSMALQGRGSSAPAPLDDATTRALESAAVTAFAALGCAARARRHLRHPGWDRHQRGQHHAGSPPTRSSRRCGRLPVWRTREPFATLLRAR